MKTGSIKKEFSFLTSLSRVTSKAVFIFSSVNDSACADILDMMCADAGFHADQARLAHWRAALLLGHATTFAAARWRRAHRGPRLGTSSCIDADYGDRGIGYLGHGVLLVFGAPSQHSIAGRAGAGPDHPISRLRLSIPLSGRSEQLC
jgi:hypothetical protein